MSFGEDDSFFDNDFIGGILKSEKAPTDSSEVIVEYISSSPGLACNFEGEKFDITQLTDGKVMSFHQSVVEEVLSRLDSNGKEFLQVNFIDGKKVLLTEQLIGFKPVINQGLDIEKLPKVVTTPDLISVVEAIEESMSSDVSLSDEIEVLKKVFDAVLAGGEAVGFDLSAEKAWVGRLTMYCSTAASA